MKSLQNMLFVCTWTSLGWFYILAQTQIPEWMMCKWAWMHQERVFGKEPCLQWAVWQSKYLLKDKLMTVSCKCRQIHYWNASQYFGLILSKNKSQSSNTCACVVCVCVCVCITLLPKQNERCIKGRKNLSTHFLEIFKLNLVYYCDQLLLVSVKNQ